MPTITTPPSPPPDDQDQTAAKGAVSDGTVAREQAFGVLNVWRPHLIAKFQHAFLSHLLTHGEASAHDLDGIPVPDGIRRVFIGAAVAELARRRLIRKAGPPSYTTRGGRHGCYLERWTLATGADGVQAWRSSHPIPPEPEPTEHTDHE